MKQFVALLTVFVGATSFAQLNESGKFMTASLGGEPMMQMVYPNAELCRLNVEATMNQPSFAEMKSKGISYSCGQNDMSSTLVFDAVLHDEILGYDLTFHVRTEHLCATGVQGTLAEKIQNSDKARYTLIKDCVRRS